MVLSARQPAVAELLIDYAAWGRATRGWADKTVYDYRLRCHNTHEWLASNRGRGLLEAQRRDIEAFLLATCRSASGRNGAIQALRAFYRFLVAEGIRGDDPTAQVNRLRDRPPLPKALTRREAVRFMAAARRRGAMWEALGAVLLHTGLRREEVRTLAWDALGDGWVRFTAKGGVERSLPLHPVAAAALARWKPLCPSLRWVFPSPVSPLVPVSTTTVGKWVQRLGEDIGIHVHPHQLRHTAATQLLERGADVRVVQEVLGHRQLSTTARYLRVRDVRLVEAVHLLDYDQVS